MLINNPTDVFIVTIAKYNIIANSYNNRQLGYTVRKFVICLSDHPECRTS